MWHHVRRSGIPPFPHHDIPSPDEDPIFGFRISNWFEPFEFTPNPPETSDERYKRHHDEAEYRHSTNQTLWHRYEAGEASRKFERGRLPTYVLKGGKHKFKYMIQSLSFPTLGKYYQ